MQYSVFYANFGSCIDKYCACSLLFWLQGDKTGLESLKKFIFIVNFFYLQNSFCILLEKQAVRLGYIKYMSNAVIYNESA
jgi:hypothetical protein